MPTIDVSQTNVKKEGTALTIEPTKDPKSGAVISTQSPSPEIKESPTIEIASVKEQKSS